MSNNLERPEPDPTDTQKITQLNESLGILEGALTNLITKPLDADGSTTLTDAQALRNMYFDLTGALAAPENVIVPNNVKGYWVRNSTTGGQTVTFKTLSGTGISVTSTWKHLLCDGTNVIAVA